LAKQYQPTAVSLDVFLPDMLGWTVLSQLKQNPLTRHIPVQIITLDEDRQHGMARGAFSFVTKPASTEGVEAALARIKEYAKAPQAPAGRGRRPRRTGEHRGVARPRRHRDRRRRYRRRGLADAAQRTLRLCRARSAAAGHVGFRGPGGAARRRDALRRAGC